MPSAPRAIVRMDKAPRRRFARRYGRPRGGARPSSPRAPTAERRVPGGPGGQAAAGAAGVSPVTGAASRAGRLCAASISARLWRWRAVIEPIVLVSVIGTVARNRRARVCPQRCWLIRSSATAMRLGLPRRGQDHVRGGRLAVHHPALELGAREANLVGARKGPHVLRAAGDRRCRVHLVLPNARRRRTPCCICLHCKRACGRRSIRGSASADRGRRLPGRGPLRPPAPPRPARSAS